MDAGAQGPTPLPRLQMADALLMPLQTELEDAPSRSASSDLSIYISNRDYFDTCNITRLRWQFIDVANIANLAATVKIFHPKPGETEDL